MPTTPGHAPTANTPCPSAQRLVLREFGASDLQAVVQLHQDPRTRARLVDDYPLHEPAPAARFLARLRAFYREQPGLGIWHASERQADGTLVFIGWFSLMPLYSRPGEVELGARLSPLTWGRGLALDGGEALVAHAVEVLALPRVWGACDPQNQGARLCLSALGFAATGLAPYDTGHALHHVLDATQWPAWKARTRRARLRLACAALRRGPAMAHAA